MPDIAGTHNDGSVAYGSQAVTIGTSTFILEKIDIKRPSKTTIRRNEVGVPNGKFMVRELEEGTAVMQIPTATTPAPALFTEITLAKIGGGSTVIFHISEVGESFGNEEEQKLNISLQQKISS